MTGSMPLPPGWIPCGPCSGAGVVGIDIWTGIGQPCDDCAGTGWAPGPCPECSSREGEACLACTSGLAVLRELLDSVGDP